MLWRVSEPAVAAVLVLGEIGFGDGVLLGGLGGLVFGGGVHAAEMLGEEVFAVEVVVV